MTKLFSKEKDIFLKVVNSILVIWLMVAIVITLGVGIKIINKEVVPTYETYSKEVCALDKIPAEEIDQELAKNNCNESYISEKKYIERMNKANIDNILISISNIVIVSLFLHLLNKKSK